MKTGNWELYFNGILNIGVTVAKWENKPTLDQVIKVVPEMPLTDAEALLDGLIVVPEGFDQVRFTLEEVFDEVDV